MFSDVIGKILSWLDKHLVASIYNGIIFVNSMGKNTKIEKEKGTLVHKNSYFQTPSQAKC